MRHPLLLAFAVLMAAAPTARAADAPPPSPDDAYRFAAGAGEERAVTLARTPSGVSFVWTKPAAAGWDTALLGLKSAGAEFDPWVAISAGSGRVEQHLDAGARGLRFVNLSGLRDQLKDGATVSLETHGLTVDPGPATVRVFANGLDLKGTILILAPHPDDAEIATFGLYSGRNATVVTVTSGNAGDFNYRANVSDPAEHYLLKGFLRAVDSVTVPWQGGVPPERAYNLGYFDARLQTMHDAPDQVVPELYGPNDDTLPYRKANPGHLLPVASRKNSWTNLVADLTQVLQTVKPAIIVMPHPQLDAHRDHDFTSVAAMEAYEKWGGTARFLLYTNHSSENHYPFGPAGTAVSLPPWSTSPLAVQGIFSLPLDKELQRRKLFALESMHDLRLSPAEQEACDSTPGIARHRDDYPRVASVDYFRRGPRENEFFFVFDAAGARDVIRAFLATPRQ